MNEYLDTHPLIRDLIAGGIKSKELVILKEVIEEKARSCNPNDLGELEFYEKKLANLLRHLWHAQMISFHLSAESGWTTKENTAAYMDMAEKELKDLEAQSDEAFLIRLEMDRKLTPFV